MTRERNAILGSIVLWLVLLVLFGSVVAFYQPLPTPVLTDYPTYTEYMDALTEAATSNIAWLIGLVVSILALYKVIKGISKWYVLGDSHPKSVEYHTVDI